MLKRKINLKEALIVIDIQNDFCKGGNLEIKDSNFIIPKVNNLIQKFKLEGKKVIATKDWHPKNHKYFVENKIGNYGEGDYWVTHCVKNTKGSEFHPELIKDFDKIIYKGVNEKIDSYSAFFDNKKLRETELREYLEKEGIEILFVVGLATDYCIKYTVIDGLKLGYNIRVVIDCCKAVNLNDRDGINAINEMKKNGAEIIDSFEIC